ncbi:MAG: MoaD/ThiS family protein [Bacteroidetes bacterium]|nr:MoaD/ThiS family protein [Bacteroidota bacterium]MBK8144383.1 MoaD/ThiS family protein [Bacteroidota bacterium]MBP6315322.1 MoaD/ThiS family protein [Chitinophagaceae bacterium]
MDEYIKILLFGNLVEIVGGCELTFPYVADTETLIEALYAKYENLRAQTFSIAVNKSIILENTKIENRDEVALLPPFSGG